MKYEVQLDGRTWTLDLERQGSALRWSLEGADSPEQADLLEVEPGVYSLLLANGRSFDIKSGLNYDGSVWIDLDGRRRRVEITDPRRNGSHGRRRHGGGRAQIMAPMPGKVIRVLVAPGDEVEAGQGLVVVEAMKMQNEMKSPKPGTVAAVHTSEGATVAPGEVLVVID